MNVAQIDTAPASGPTRIAILIVPEYSNLTLGVVIEPLRVANGVANAPLFTWRTYGDGTATVRSSSGLTLAVDGELDDAEAFDCLFVLASEHAEHYYTERIARALRAARRRRKPICAFDSGPYYLALAGLLDGRRATTHWVDLEEFESRFPRVHAVPDRFVTDGDVSTTSGSLPSFDFMLDFIRRQHGLALAMTVSGLFIYDKETPGLEPQRMIAATRLRSRSPALLEAIRIMEDNISPALPVAEIGITVGVSVKQLGRLFRRELNTTPGSFYRSLRLNVGRRFLETTNRATVDIALACGFESRSAFVRAYGRQFGQPPSLTRRG